MHPCWLLQSRHGTCPALHTGVQPATQLPPNVGPASELLPDWMVLPVLTKVWQPVAFRCRPSFVVLVVAAAAVVFGFMVQWPLVAAVAVWWS